jgi:hypothetical protein
MNAPELMSGLFCAKRQHPLDCDFVLAYDGYLEIFDRKLLWPTEDSLVTVLCRECFETFEYSQQDVRTVPVPPWHPYTPGTRYIWRIQARCGRENCGFQKVVHLQSRGSTKSDICRRLSEKHAQITCPECAQKIPLTDVFDDSTERLGIV